MQQPIKVKESCHICSARYKIDLGTNGSPLICTLLGKFTRNCSSVASSSIANCYLMLFWKVKIHSHEENNFKEVSKRSGLSNGHFHEIGTVLSS